MKERGVMYVYCVCLSLDLLFSFSQMHLNIITVEWICHKMTVRPRACNSNKPLWKPVRVKPSGSALTRSFCIFRELEWNCGIAKYFSLCRLGRSIIIYLFYLLLAYHDLSTEEKLFQCASRGSFIHKSHKCNGIYECPDKSDENECENGILL